jgi:hypothetical protein
MPINKLMAVSLSLTVREITKIWHFFMSLWRQQIEKAKNHSTVCENSCIFFVARFKI